MTPLTQAIARDLANYALGEPDEDRLPEIYRRLSECPASRRFVEEVRGARARLARDLEAEADWRSRLNGVEPKRPHLNENDPDFEPLSPRAWHSNGNGHVSAVAASRARDASGPNWFRILLVLVVLFVLIQCFAIWIFLAGESRKETSKSTVIQRPNSSATSPALNPKWLPPQSRTYVESPKSMISASLQPRLELSQGLIGVGVGDESARGIETEIENSISSIGTKVMPYGQTQQDPEATIEFQDAPWSPRHRLALIRILAKPLSDGSPPLARVEFNPKHVRSHRLLSRSLRLPWRVASPTSGLYASAFLVEIELNEATGASADPLSPHDRETLFLTLGDRDPQGAWRSVFEQSATDGPDAKPASPPFRAAIAIAAWRLSATDDPLKGTVSPYLIRQLAQQAPEAASTSEFGKLNRDVPDFNVTPP